MQLITNNHINFHSVCKEGSSIEDEVILLGPCVQVAFLWLSASQDLTYFSGCHIESGGPLMDTNINEDMC